MAVEAGEWSRSFHASLGSDVAVATVLREASLAGNLALWTSSLTGLVGGSFRRLGLEVAAKGHRCTALPVAREEYLGLDVTALPAQMPEHLETDEDS